jgi:hypothetical protein
VRVRTVGIVVVYDVECPRCSEIARELPDLVRVPVTVRSCREAGLGRVHPDLPTGVASCARPALGLQRRDGSVRWWPGLTGAAAVLPVLRPGSVREAVGMLYGALRSRRG